MFYQYTNPDAAGCLLETEACGQVVKELERVEERFKHKIDREAAKRRKELEAAMGYASVEEIHEAFGYGEITEKQYYRYVELFEDGETALEQHTPTRSERVRQILLSIRKDIAREQQEWEFSALSPEEQARELKRRSEAAQSWKDKIKAIKAQVNQSGKSETDQSGNY